MKFYFVIYILAFQCCYSQDLLSEKELRKRTVYLSTDEIVRSDKKLLSIEVVETKGLRVIPESIFEHSEVQMLNISGAKLGAISKKICSLKSLQYLVLAGDSLTMIPNLIEMNNLKGLSLNANSIKNIPMWLFRLQSLSVLDVSSQFVSGIELPSIDNNYTLRTINLSNNRLEIAKGFFNFSNLESLDLSNCNLTSVPEEIKNCPSIKYLNLSGNRIKELPEWIFTMKHLSQINLANTELDIFPERLTTIPTLTFIDVRGAKMELSTSTVDKIKRRGNKFLEIYWERGASSIKKVNN